MFKKNIQLDFGFDESNKFDEHTSTKTITFLQIKPILELYVFTMVLSIAILFVEILRNRMKTFGNPEKKEIRGS